MEKQTIEIQVAITPALVFSSEFCEFFQDAHLVEHLRTGSSDHGSFLQVFKNTSERRSLIYIVKESSHKYFN